MGDEESIRLAKAGRMLAFRLSSWKTKNPGYKNTQGNYTSVPYAYSFFSHPDYTVGFGITPNQPPAWVADYTAGGESHPAPKNLFIYGNHYNTLSEEMQEVLQSTCIFSSPMVNFLGGYRRRDHIWKISI